MINVLEAVKDAIEDAKALKARVEYLALASSVSNMQFGKVDAYCNGTNKFNFQLPQGSKIIGYSLRDLGFPWVDRNVTIQNVSSKPQGGYTNVNLFLSSAPPANSYKITLNHYRVLEGI